MNLKNVHSFPIIPGVYNDNIIEELEIDYIVLERSIYKKSEIDRIIGAKNTLQIVESFKIADKWDISRKELEEIFPGETSAPEAPEDPLVTRSCTQPSLLSIKASRG